MKKKSIIATLALAMTLSALTGCGSEPVKETTEETSETTVSESTSEEELTDDSAQSVNDATEQSVESTTNETTSQTTLYTMSNTDSVGTATVTVNVYDRPSTDGIIIGTIEANEPIYCLYKVFDNGWHIIDTSSYDIPYEYGFVDPSIVSNPKADAMTTHFPESSFWTLSVTINSDGTTTVTEIY